MRGQDFIQVSRHRSDETVNPVRSRSPVALRLVCSLVSDRRRACGRPLACALLIPSAHTDAHTDASALCHACAWQCLLTLRSGADSPPCDCARNAAVGHKGESVSEPMAARRVFKQFSHALCMWREHPAGERDNSPPSSPAGALSRETVFCFVACRVVSVASCTNHRERTRVRQRLRGNICSAKIDLEQSFARSGPISPRSISRNAWAAPSARQTSTSRANARFRQQPSQSSSPRCSIEFSSDDGLGIHQPRSISTAAFVLVAQGRARDRATCPAVIRSSFPGKTNRYGVIALSVRSLEGGNQPAPGKTNYAADAVATVVNEGG